MGLQLDSLRASKRLACKTLLEGDLMPPAVEDKSLAAILRALSEPDNSQCKQLLAALFNQVRLFCSTLAVAIVSDFAAPVACQRTPTAQDYVYDTNEKPFSPEERARFLHMHDFVTELARRQFRKHGRYFYFACAKLMFKSASTRDRAFQERWSCGRRCWFLPQHCTNTTTMLWLCWTRAESVFCSPTTSKNSLRGMWRVRV